MKKHLFAISLTTIFAINSYSQIIIPNNSFETWTNGKTPDGWNNEYSQPDATVSKATPAFDGSFALKASVFHVTASNTDEFAYISSRFPVTAITQPQKLTFYYKANIVAGDLSKIYLTLFNSGASIGTATFVASPQTALTNYQFSENTISYTSGALPDSVEFIILGGDAENALQKNGTYLIIDKVEFDGTNLLTAMPDFKSSNLSLNISPNPASGILCVSGEDLPGSTITIYNILGKECYKAETPSLKSEIKMDISKLVGGIYILKVQKGDLITQKKFIKE